MVHSVLESKVKVVRRLESQLSMHGGEGDVSWMFSVLFFYGLLFICYVTEVELILVFGN